MATEEDPQVAALKARQGITIVLDLASLETVKLKSGQYALLNCDDHQGLMKKHGKNPADYRPDILHQELLALLDSPLNKAGKLKVYIHTVKNVLIEVSPQCRIPRTFKRFSGLMVQLLHKLKIRSSDGSRTLLKVIKNPISRHLPTGCKCYGLEYQGALYSPQALAMSLPEDKPVVFIVGAMATGSITVNDHPYLINLVNLVVVWQIEEMISISDFPLSGATSLNRLLGAIESHWGIV